MDLVYNDVTKKYELQITLTDLNTIMSATGFVAGFILGDVKDMYKKPLLTIARCGFSGIGAAVCAGVVGNIYPPITKYLVTTACGASIVFYGRKLL